MKQILPLINHLREMNKELSHRMEALNKLQIREPFNQAVQTYTKANSMLIGEVSWAAESLQEALYDTTPDDVLEDRLAFAEEAKEVFSKTTVEYMELIEALDKAKLIKLEDMTITQAQFTFNSN